MVSSSKTDIVPVENETTTADNIVIKYNSYKSAKTKAVFVVPGWFMTKDSNAFASLSEDLSQYYDVYTIDLRGHGRSSGAYTFTADEVKDLRAVIQDVRKHDKYEKYYLMGFSLGGALVINYTAQYKDVDSVIAVSAPTSFGKIENHFWKKEAFIPTFQKFELKRWFSIRPALPVMEKVNPIDVVKDISPIPIYFIAGENDKTVYPWHVKKLYEKANEPKKITMFENTIHAEDIYLASPQTFVNSCYNWYEYNK